MNTLATPTNVLEMMRLFRDDPDGAEGQEQEGSEAITQTLKKVSISSSQDSLVPDHRPPSAHGNCRSLAELSHEGDMDRSKPSTPTKPVSLHHSAISQ